MKVNLHIESADTIRFFDTSEQRWVSLRRISTGDSKNRDKTVSSSKRQVGCPLTNDGHINPNDPFGGTDIAKSMEEPIWHGGKVRVIDIWLVFVQQVKEGGGPYEIPRPGQEKPGLGGHVGSILSTERRGHLGGHSPPGGKQHLDRPLQVLARGSMRGGGCMGQQHPVTGGHHEAPDILATGLRRDTEREGTPNGNEAGDEDDGLKEVPRRGRWPSVAEAKHKDHVGEQKGQY